MNSGCLGARVVPRGGERKVRCPIPLLLLTNTCVTAREHGNTCPKVLVLVLVDSVEACERERLLFLLSDCFLLVLRTPALLLLLLLLVREFSSAKPQSNSVSQRVSLFSVSVFSCGQLHSTMSPLIGMFAFIQNSVDGGGGGVGDDSNDATAVMFS